MLRLRVRLRAVAATVAAIAALRCGKRESPAPAGRPAATQRAAVEKPAPYTYPAPVKGRVHEVNVGGFDLVDGIAYTAGNGAGTVVYASSKPVASPVLADSPCPMTEARSLSTLRDAEWAEVTLDAHGHSPYFAFGKRFGGSTFDKTPGGRNLIIPLRHASHGRISGTARHREYGSFEFDLPVSIPQVREVSEMDRTDGRRSDETAPRPAEPAVTAAYVAVREAALRKDLKSLLMAQGFGQKPIAAIRGLDGIDADLAVFADRFLDPGTPGEFTAKPGTAYVRTEGTNSKGKKFANYYHFNSCGDRLVLVWISVNPQ